LTGSLEQLVGGGGSLTKRRADCVRAAIAAPDTDQPVVCQATAPRQRLLQTAGQIDLAARYRCQCVSADVDRARAPLKLLAGKNECCAAGTDIDRPARQRYCAAVLPEIRTGVDRSLLPSGQVERRAAQGQVRSAGARSTAGQHKHPLVHFPSCRPDG